MSYVTYLQQTIGFMKGTSAAALSNNLKIVMDK